MNRETSNVLLGFLVGAVAGGVSALLFAPSTGRETRQKIVDNLGHTREKLADELEHAKEYARNHKEAIKEGIHEGKGAYNRVVGKGETI